MMAPVLHSALTTLLAVIMLAFSEFDFIVRCVSRSVSRPPGG